MAKYGISASELNRQFNEPDPNNSSFIQALKAIQTELSNDVVLRKAKEQLSEHDYNFLVNSSRDTLTQLLNSYASFVEMMSEEVGQIQEVDEVEEQNSWSFVDAVEAETMGDKIKKNKEQLTSRNIKQRERHDKRRDKKVKEDDEKADDLQTEEPENDETINKEQ